MTRLLYPVSRAFALTQLLRAGDSVERLLRPTDAKTAHASGNDPDRLLLLGSGPAMGYGVLSHDLALPGQLARKISAASGRGVTVDVVCDSDMVIQTTLGFLSTVTLARYDAIIITVGVNDALRSTSPRKWRRHVAELAEYLSERMPRYAVAFFVAIPSIRSLRAFSHFSAFLPDIHRELLNRDAAAICAQFPRVAFVPFETEVESGDRYRVASTYAAWAKLISRPVIEVLISVPRVATIPSSEESRQRALDALQILDTEPEQRFDRIVEFAQKFFGVHSAAITFVDSSREWMKTTVGFDHKVALRGSLLSDYAILQSLTFVVEDALKDPRFVDNPFVHGPPHIRFYAAHPLESQDGERVGVIAVFDPQPRSFSSDDTRILRDLAHLVQRELREGGAK